MRNLVTAPAAAMTRQFFSRDFKLIKDDDLIYRERFVEIGIFVANARDVAIAGYNFINIPILTSDFEIPA